MRREERVTVQGPVKEQQPDGMSHRGGGGTRGGAGANFMRAGEILPPLQTPKLTLPHAHTALPKPPKISKFQKNSKNSKNSKRKIQKNSKNAKIPKKTTSLNDEMLPRNYPPVNVHGLQVPSQQGCPSGVRLFFFSHSLQPTVLGYGLGVRSWGTVLGYGLGGAGLRLTVPDAG